MRVKTHNIKDFHKSTEKYLYKFSETNVFSQTLVVFIAFIFLYTNNNVLAHDSQTF